MEWSRHAQQGEAPTPRAGHAGVTIGENWFIVGGGDNKSGMFCTFPFETLNLPNKHVLLFTLHHWNLSWKKKITF